MPIPPMTRHRRALGLPLTAGRAVVGLALVSGLLAGCGIVGAPAFDPTGPCTADGQAPGAYPDLEALIPTTLDGKAPDSLDSGRNCSQDGLGPLWDDGFREVRFAGAIWQTGSESGTSLAVFAATGLTADQVGGYYEGGAQGSEKVSGLTTSHPTIAGRSGYRLDVVNGDYLQTVITWPSTTPDVVNVILVSSSARDVTDPAGHASAVDAAMAAFGG